MKNIFVSYNFNDREMAHSIRSWSVEYGGSVNARFHFVNNVSQDGDLAIDREINTTMNNCDTVLFIVGNNSHNSPWINREAELANSKNLKKIVMRKSNAGVPYSLGSNYGECAWGGNALAQII